MFKIRCESWHWMVKAWVYNFASRKNDGGRKRNEKKKKRRGNLYFERTMVKCKRNICIDWQKDFMSHSYQNFIIWELTNFGMHFLCLFCDKVPSLLIEFYKCESYKFP